MQNDFFNRTGKVALGSRLRLLTARFTEEAAEIYRLYGVDFTPKWFPAFFVLAEEGRKSISEISVAIGHSQPSVSKIVGEMIAAGLVMESGEPGDKRRTMVELTEEGKAVAENIRIQCGDVDEAVQSLIDEAAHDLWAAVREWETLLQAKPLLQRVREARRRRESGEVRVVPYEAKYETAFRELNAEWIARYFKMEAADHASLGNPQGYIIDKGGMIFVALYENEPVGVCALNKMDDPEYDYELAKMAVSPKAQGRGVGVKLAQAAIDAARKAGASKLFLDSNTRLEPAINLYRKLGFTQVFGRPSPYSRTDIQMEMKL